MEPSTIKTLIESKLTDCQALVQGDGNHFEAVVISPEFTNQSTLQKHKMVYASLGDKIHTGEIHALSIKAYTPEEWQAQA